MSKPFILRLNVTYTLLPASLSNSGVKANRNSMPRRMTTKEIESEVTAIGNGGHVIVPKDWLGKKVRVTLIEE